MVRSAIFASLLVSGSVYAQEVYKGTPIDSEVAEAELEVMKGAIDSADDGPYDLVYVVDLDGEITCSDEAGRKTICESTPTADPMVWINDVEGPFTASSHGTELMFEPLQLNPFSYLVVGPTLPSAPPSAHKGTGPYVRTFLKVAQGNAATNTVSSMMVSGNLAGSHHSHQTQLLSPYRPMNYTYISPWSFSTSRWRSGGDFGFIFSHMRRVWDLYFLRSGSKPITVSRGILPGAFFRITARYTYSQTTNAPLLSMTFEYQQPSGGMRKELFNFHLQNIGWGNASFARLTTIAMAPNEGADNSLHLSTSWLTDWVKSGSQSWAWSAWPDGVAVQCYPSTHTGVNVPWPQNVFPVSTHSWAGSSATDSVDTRVK